MILAARSAAVVLACAVALYAIRLGDGTPAVAVMALAGAGLVAAGTVRAGERAVWAGVFLLGLTYATALALRDGDIDPFAPAVAVALYLVTEAGDVVSSGAGRMGARAWHSATVGFASALVVAVLLIAGTLARTAGPVAVAGSALCGALLLLGLVSVAGGRAHTDH